MGAESVRRQRILIRNIEFFIFIFTVVSKPEQ